MGWNIRGMPGYFVAHVTLDSRNTLPTMRGKPLDWKFWIVLLATLAGVIAPAWLWRFDLSSRSLEVELTSSTSLSPALPKAGLDVSVVVAGRTLTEPFGSTLVLRNTGAKPILPGEVEGQIEVEVTGKGRLVQAQVVDRQPASLSPALSISGARFSIQPLLLNPGDSLTIAVLTENGVPNFSPRARIAGVSDVTLRKAPNSPMPPRPVWISAVCSAFVVSAVFMLLITTAIPGRKFHPAVIGITALGALVLAASTAGDVFYQYFERTFFSRVALALAITFVSALPTLLFWRPKKSNEREQ
jgi:hypothetical protein